MIINILFWWGDGIIWFFLLNRYSTNTCRMYTLFIINTGPSISIYLYELTWVIHSRQFGCTCHIVTIYSIFAPNKQIVSSKLHNTIVLPKYIDIMAYPNDQVVSRRDGHDCCQVCQWAQAQCCCQLGLVKDQVWIFIIAPCPALPAHKQLQFWQGEYQMKKFCTTICTRLINSW